MASMCSYVTGVSHDLFMFTEENYPMEAYSDKNNIDLAVTDSNSSNFKLKFDQKLVNYDQQHQGSQRKPWTSERITEVINEIKKAQVAMNCGQRRTPMDYYWMNKYDIMTIGCEDHLIFKRTTSTTPTVLILPREQYFDVLLEIHKSCGHGGRDKILTIIKNKYYIPKKAVEIFVSLCPVCATKRNVPKKDLVSLPIVSRDLNIRGQVDLLDFQSDPDGDYKWLLIYQDNTTKFLNLRPLKTINANEVASELIKIFLIFGAPYILQSDNGREFTANVIKELAVMWPDCKIVHGNPPTQTSVERSNQDVENMLRSWMTENQTKKWSVGCYFVQYYNNSSFHSVIGRSPYKALFGREHKAGLYTSNIPASLLSTIDTEEQLKSLTEEQINEAECNDDFKIADENSSKTALENIENIESNFICPLCHNKTVGGVKCEHCNSVAHPICELTEGEDSHCSEPVSVICKVESDINIQKDEAPKGLKRAAENIIETAVKKIPDLGLDSCVIINVPKADRGPLNIKNLHGKIVGFTNGVYKIGTSNGTIKNWFPRQMLQCSDTGYSEEISNTPISLAEAVASQLPFVVQGFQKCTCKPALNQCRNNRCACFKNKVLCGPKCHRSLTCVNN